MIARGLTSWNQYSCGFQRRFAGVLTSYFLRGLIVLEKNPVDSGLINAPKSMIRTGTAMKSMMVKADK
jgi:hypothetical protein